MSVQLLDKIRRINKLLQTAEEQRVNFKDICQIMGDVLESNILILSKKGKILASHISDDMEPIEELLLTDEKLMVNQLLNNRLLNILSTKENINMAILGFSEMIEEASYIGMILPVNMSGDRLGTIFLYRQKNMYGVDDVILGEYGTTVVGLEMMRSMNKENLDIVRERKVVTAAISTLSYSEQDAMKHIFRELDGSEGVLVASKVADKMNITRSVIVNGLRKFESAGVIESRSLGMKGTYIKVIIDLLLEEIEKL